MVVEKGPGKTTGFGFYQQATQTLNKLFAIFIVDENIDTANAPDDDVLQQTGDIYAGLTRHSESVAGVVDFSTTSPLVEK